MIAEAKEIPQSEARAVLADALRQDPDATRRSLREFSSTVALRSAMASEITEETSFYRRAIRVEDLELLDFDVPFAYEETPSLEALSAHRLLQCVNEVDMCRPSLSLSDDQRTDLAAYTSDVSRQRASLIRPFLERFCFSTLAHLPTIEDTDRCRTELNDWLDTGDRFWRRLMENLGRYCYVTQGLKFVAIQECCLHRAKCSALQIAEATGYFDGVQPHHRPRVMVNDGAGLILADAAAALGVTHREHSYWQFYLPMSLAIVNLLHRLRRPQTPYKVLGGAFAVEAAVAVLANALEGWLAGKRGSVERACLIDRDALVLRFEGALAALSAQAGATAIREFMAGWSEARTVIESSHADLDAQLSWIARQEEYVRLAINLRARIHRERPSIHRDTFTEPRAMCSTTHVHDEHRLVEIESGRMIFWSNHGMRLTFDPGDAMFVPRGRLHGSSIESDVCRYHQPVIPEEWVIPIEGWR